MNLFLKVLIKISYKLLNKLKCLQKISFTLESLKTEVEFVLNSNESCENQVRLDTIKQLYSKVS